MFLDDSDLHPRVRQRIELTRGLVEARGVPTFRVDTIGETRTDRLVSLVLLGDLVLCTSRSSPGSTPGRLP